jgi:TonB-dependent starch-binding outer membrane protein SusC
MREHPRRLVLWLGALAGVLWVAPLHAQGVGVGVVTGRVTDAARGNPLAYAQVYATDTPDRVARSDADGRYRLGGLTVGAHTIAVRIVGYASKSAPVTVAAGTTATLDFQLTSQPLELDALVVTGQGGEISKRRLATQVDVVGPEAIEASPAKRIDELLQAKVPGAQIRLTSGQQGTTSIIRTRGVTSVTNNSTPVIYVDGVRVDNLNTVATLGLNLSGVRSQGAATSALADLPIDNIERVEFVPGGAATTLYGSDAANGVIQIFTKRGTAGKPRGYVEGRVGYDTPQTQFLYFDATSDMIYRNGFTQGYSAGIDGGSDAITYSASGNLRASESQRIYGDNHQFGLRNAIGAQLGTRAKYDGTVSFTQSNAPRFRNGNSGGYNALWLLEDGRISALGFDNNIDSLNNSAYSTLKTFVQDAERLQNNTVFTRAWTTSHTLSYTPMPSLKANATFGVNNRFSKEQAIVTNQFLISTKSFPAGTTDRGTIQNYERNYTGFTFNAGLQHTANIGTALSIISAVGGQLFRNDDAQVAYTATNVRDGAQTLTGAGVTASSDLAYRVANYGVFAQTNMSLLERYTMELGIRADKNTAFGQNTGAQLYPKVGLVYAVSDEPWLRAHLPENVVSDLRLRGAYGVAGQFPPPFANDRTIAFNSFNGQQAATFGQPGNRDLKPERTGTLEFGADIGLLRNVVSLGLGYYTSRTTDALINAPPAPSTGLPSQLRNIGEISNKGLELRATVTPINRSAVRLTLNGAYNTLKNRVVDLGGTPPFAISGYGASTVQGIVQEGFPVGYLRGAKAIFDDAGKVVRIDQLQYLGKPTPDKFGSFGAQLGLGSRLTLSTSADYQFGAQQQSFDRAFRYLYGVKGTDDYVPAAATAQYGSRAAVWQLVMNRWVENTDYVSLRTMTVDYRPSARFVPRLARDARVSFSVTNPYRWASSHWDPETDLSTASDQGAAAVGGYNYATDSAPRTYLLTLRFGF